MTSRAGAGIGGNHRSVGQDEWLTPPSILDALGPFDLDPCAPIERPWPTAKEHYTVNDDGLAVPWHGFVWCNPPYGRATGAWLARLRQHASGVALVFARTETSMFVEHGWSADALLFLEGRLHFHTVDGTRAAHNSGAPSVLLGYGAEAVDRLSSCGLPGYLVTNAIRVEPKAISRAAGQDQHLR